MRKRVIVLASLVCAVASVVPSFARRDLIDIMRSDLRTQKKVILARAMQMTEEESNAFWPVYDRYESELAKLNDERLSIIRDYVANYGTMTDATAKSLVKRSFKWQEGRTGLLKKYYRRMEKVVPPKVAARWVQAEHAIDTMIDVQVASEIPLMR